jgi:hypothetical protein
MNYSFNNLTIRTMCKQILSFGATAICFLLLACSGKQSEGEKQPGKPALAAPGDTLSNELQCNLTIDGKSYAVAPDSIDAYYTFSDSSVAVTVKGIGGGYLAFIIPNLYKCPAKIPNGFSSINTKIAGTEELAVRPTVTYSLDLQASNTFNNYNDGLHEGKPDANAFEVQRASPTGEGSPGSGFEYLMKIRIHTTALKNVYNAAAKEKNKDYEIEGGLVIKPKLSL